MHKCERIRWTLLRLKTTREKNVEVRTVLCEWRNRKNCITSQVCCNAIARGLEASIRFSYSS
jgi:hypothetical protein